MTTGTVDGVPVISVSGDVDRSCVARLDGLVRTHRAQHPCLVLDLHACSFIRDSLLAAMLVLSRFIHHDRVLAVVAPYNLRLLFATAGVSDRAGFRLFADVPSATAYLSQLA